MLYKQSYYIECFVFGLIGFLVQVKIDESSESLDFMMEVGLFSFEEMEDNVFLGIQFYLFEFEVSLDEEFNQ